MTRDQIIGIGLLIISIVVVIVYGWLVFGLGDLWIIVVKITVFIGVAAVFGVLAWIGYTLATTPPPKPIEEIEKELEDELKKLEKEMKEEEGKKEGKE